MNLSDTDQSVAQSALPTSAVPKLLALEPQETHPTVDQWRIRWLDVAPMGHEEPGFTNPGSAEPGSYIEGDFTIEQTPPPGFDEQSFLGVIPVTVFLHSENWLRSDQTDAGVVYIC